MAESLSESPPQQGPICPVCFRDYSDSETNLIPRILQCGHTYCTECLERLLNMELEEDEDQTMIFNIHYAGRRWTTTRRFPSIFNPPRPPRNEIKCPTCKMVNRISNRDINTLTKNFALLGLRTQSSVTLHPKKSYYCKDHDHEKRIYCRDCRSLICAYCQLYGDHKGHECEIATEAAKPSVESLKRAKEKLGKDFDDLTEGESAVSAAIVKLEKNRERCEKKVRHYFNRFIGRLRRRRDDLLLDIGSWTDDQMSVLDAQLTSLSNAIKDSESIQANCQSLIEGDPLEALTQEDELLKEVDEIQQKVVGLSFQPLIHPWMRCKLTRSEYDDSIDDILVSCKLKFDTDVSQRKGGGAALNFSTDEEEEADSESGSSAVDDEDNKDFSDDDLQSGGGRGESSRMSFQDQTSTRLVNRRGGSSADGRHVSGVGGRTSLRDRDEDDIDDLKKKREQEIRLLHSQETPVGGAGASLMPKLELAEPPDIPSRWGYHPSSSSSSLNMRHSMSVLSSANRPAGVTGGGARSSSGIRPSGSTPVNVPLRGDTDPVSPTQASKSSASFLFNPNPNSIYERQRSLADQLQRVMETLNHSTPAQNVSDDDEDDGDADSLDGESRHRLHLVENLSPPFDYFDTVASLSLGLRNRDNNSSLSTSSNEASFHVDELDEGSPSPNTYPKPSYVTMSVLDSVDLMRRSRLLRERMGERSALESDEELEATNTVSRYPMASAPTIHNSSPNHCQRSTSDTPSRSPLQTTDHEDTDFAFGHHLSLPVDSHGQETEIVFPTHYSWTADHGEAGGVAAASGGVGGARERGGESDGEGREGDREGERGVGLPVEVELSIDSLALNEDLEEVVPTPSNRDRTG